MQYHLRGRRVPNAVPSSRPQAQRYQWQRINAFAVDDFWAPTIPEQYSVGAQLKRDLFPKVPFLSTSTVNFAAPDPDAERKRYAALLEKYPTDIQAIGIGRSGHLALNEPGSTDFNDPQTVRVVDVHPRSKEQLMTDPNFKALGYIPEKGITVTISYLKRCARSFLIVPYRLKAEIIRDTLRSPISEAVPATIIRAMPNARLYLDEDSYSLAKNEN